MKVKSELESARAGWGKHRRRVGGERFREAGRLEARGAGRQRVVVVLVLLVVVVGW